MQTSTTFRSASLVALAAAVISSATLPLAANPGPQIFIDDEKKQEMIFGLDFERLWHYGRIGGDAAMRKRLAELAVKDLKVSYIRVAIDGLVELNGGDWGAYNTQVKLMEALRDANRDIRFFVSPRPFHEALHAHHGKGSNESKNAPFTCFPLNIGVFDHPFDPKKRKFVELKPDLAADYFIRHIRFLRSKGFNIAYMDAQNENTRFYRPREISEMVELIRAELGEEMPQVIAPSGWSMDDSANWVDEAIETRTIGTFDILSSHDTGGKLESASRMGEHSRKLGKPLWNTELHKGLDGPDDAAASNTKGLWLQIRAGFGGINQWLSLGSAKKEQKMFRNMGREIVVMRSYHIFKHLVNTAGGGNYLDSTTPEGLTSTAAFIHGDKLTVWVLNDTDVAVGDVSIMPNLHLLRRTPVEVHSWGPDNAAEGSRERIPVKPGGALQHTMQPKTLYCFTYEVQP